MKGTRNELLGLMRILTDPESLMIYEGTRGAGAKSDDSYIKSLGLTKKRYYTKLEALKEGGLVKKSGGVYIPTMRGEDIYSNINAALREYTEMFHTEKYGTMGAGDFRRMCESVPEMSKYLERNKAKLAG